MIPPIRSDSLRQKGKGTWKMYQEWSRGQASSEKGYSQLGPSASGSVKLEASRRGGGRRRCARGLLARESSEVGRNHITLG